MHDPDLLPLITFLRDGVLPSDRRAAQQVASESLSYSWSDHLLKHHPRGINDRSAERIVIPPGLRTELISYFHVPPLTGGHFGAPRVFSKLAQRFYWSTMLPDTQRFVQAGTQCQIANSPRVITSGAPLHATPTPGLFEQIAFDFIGPLPVSLHRNRYILAITDYFSRWAEAYPLPDITAESTAVCLADWTTRYGAPFVLCSDRGSHFLNQTITAFCSIWHIVQIPTSAYHPQANGLVERFNSTLIDSLRTYSLSAGSLWDEVLNAVLFAYRTSFHGGINISPDVLIFGQSLHVPLDVELQQVLHTSSLSPSDPAFIFAHAAALARARSRTSPRLHGQIQDHL